eukprot:418534_1
MNQPGNQKSEKFNITKCNSINIRAFWITTLTFWICFFVWFGNINLIPWIKKDINLSATEIVITKTMLTVSTVIFRVIIGDLLDKIGSRYCYIIIMIIGLISICFLLLINTPIQYIICNFFIGIIGSSFVITEYHTTQFFSDRIIGLANATSAGWGNFGGGCAALLMPYLASTYDINWRYLTLISGLFLLIPIFLYYYCTIDTVNGNLDYKRVISYDKLTDMTRFKNTVNDYRTWILFLLYGQCFGVEIIIITYIQSYFQYEFGLNHTDSGLIVFMFSFLNLFARSIGGYMSDKLNIHARLYLLFLILFGESIFLFIFSFGTFSLEFSIIFITFFSCFVQCAEGITFAIVPFVATAAGNNKIGPLYGIVAAGGNFGSFIFSITIFYFVSNNQLQYQYAFLIVSIVVLVSSFLTLKIKFTQQEICIVDELLLHVEGLQLQEKVTELENIDIDIDISKYENWSDKQILVWMLSIENHRFSKYKSTLTKSLTDECLTGNDLCKVNENDLKGWGITNFGDRKMLLKNINKLVHHTTDTSTTHRGDRYNSIAIDK